LANDSKNIGNVVERYSKALLELAIESKSMSNVHSDIENIINIIESSDDFNKVLKSPIISRNDQSQIINTVLKKISVSEIVIKFFSVICQNGRSFIIDRICFRFLEMEVNFKGEVRAELLSTSPQSEIDLKKIEEIIKESIGTDVSLISTVDPSIIGGYILKIGSVMLDGSVKSKLQGLRVSMKGIK
jgi:F-type H+-transporting ATPase subunit delta